MAEEKADFNSPIIGYEFPLDNQFLHNARTSNAWDPE
jgi:hypothetical protein